MIEVQIRRPCSQSTVFAEIDKGQVPSWWRQGIPVVWMCLECGASGSEAGKPPHNAVTEWMPLSEAVRLAHIEEAKGEE